MSNRFNQTHQTRHQKEKNAQTNYQQVSFNPPQLALQGHINELETHYERYVNQHYNPDSIREQFENTFKSFNSTNSKKKKVGLDESGLSEFHHAYLQKEGMLIHLINLLKQFQKHQNSISSSQMKVKLGNLQKSFIAQGLETQLKQKEELADALTQISENGQLMQNEKVKQLACTPIEEIVNGNSGMFRKVLQAFSIFNITKKDGHDDKQELQVPLQWQQDAMNKHLQLQQVVLEHQSEITMIDQFCKQKLQVLIKRMKEELKNFKEIGNKTKPNENEQQQNEQQDDEKDTQLVPESTAIQKTKHEIIESDQMQNDEMEDSETQHSKKPVKQQKGSKNTKQHSKKKQSKPVDQNQNKITDELLQKAALLRKKNDKESEIKSVTPTKRPNKVEEKMEKKDKVEKAQKNKDKDEEKDDENEMQEEESSESGELPQSGNDAEEMEEQMESANDEFL